MDPRAPKRRKVETIRDLGQEGSDPTEEPFAAPLGTHARDRGLRSEFGSSYTKETFKSSIFKLQVDELLGQVRLKHGAKDASIASSMNRVKELIEAIPPREPLSISDAERTVLASGEIRIPFPEPKPSKDANYKLEYKKPSHINAIGSYPLKLATKADQELTVDMLVMMPTSMFQDKDFLDFRYFYKKSYYVACLAAGLKNSADGSFSLRFDYLNGNRLQPVLVFKPCHDANQEDSSILRYCIRIIPSLSDGVFPSDKLSPHKCCVRFNQFRRKPWSEALSTPFYNSSLCADKLMSTYLKLIYNVSNDCAAFRDACLLGRTWLTQREILSTLSGGGFGNFEWCVLLAILIKNGGSSGLPSIPLGYSSYQLFKAMLQFLASQDLLENPYGLQSDLAKEQVVKDMPFFFDTVRRHNILYKMSIWSYRLLRFEANSTIIALSNSLLDPFDSTFVVKAHQVQLRYDYVIKVNSSVFLEGRPNLDGRNQLFVDVEKFYKILMRGLGERVLVINIGLPQEDDWDIQTSDAGALRDRQVTIGILVNPNTAPRLVDQGPSAEEQLAAASFRSFWGDRAELRRFKDGSIREGVIWSSGDVPVVKQIIQFLFQQNYGVQCLKNLSFAGAGSTSVLSLSHANSSVAPFQPLLNSFAQFERDLRQLQDLPLAIRRISAVDAALRYSSIDAPLSDGARSMSEPANVSIQFEGSGRWPDDLEGIQRTKLAFLLKLEQLLCDAIPELSVRVGIENEDLDFVNCSFLDVVYPSGASFRVRIYQDREQHLLQFQLKDKKLSGLQRERTASALTRHKKDFNGKSSHTQAIQTLCTRFPVLSPTIRMTKKWFSSHLLTSQIADEFIELLVVRTFVLPFPWRAPSSALTGFLRTIYFISRWDWRSQPLILDSSGSMSSTELESIMTRFEAWRKIDPTLNRVVLFAAWNVDPDGTTWTDHARPPKVVATRMTALAKAAFNALVAQDPHLDVSGLFVPALEDFDFVIHITTKKVEPRKKGADSTANSQFKNLQLQSVNGGQAMPFENDPIDAFIQDLEKLYGTAVALFFSAQPTITVAGVWNPTTRRPWKSRLAYSSKPTFTAMNEMDEFEIAVNRGAILAEIARLGGEFVQRIEVNTH